MVTVTMTTGLLSNCKSQIVTVFCVLWASSLTWLSVWFKSFFELQKSVDISPNPEVEENTRGADASVHSVHFHCKVLR